MKLYISGLSLIILAVVYLPLVTWMLVAIGQSKSLTRAKKIVVITVAAIIAYAIPLGDVTINSIAMAKVCPTAGLHVYKTVRVDGYLSSAGAAYVLKKFPYKFMEEPILVGTERKIVHLERKGAEIDRIVLDQPMAEYEVVNGDWTVDERLRIERLRDAVRNRVTGEVIAERLLFDPSPGWLDRLFVLRWFGGRIHGCHGAERSVPIADKVLSPKTAA